jgi:DNA-binding LacI/PurR family transcriptional regulator
MAKTMKEIAQALGISRTTVSLVLQGRGDEYRISPETQMLVRSYVEESDFKPNYFAQALNRGKTGVIGVVFPDVFESFMSKMIRGIESALYPQGYTLSVSTTRFDLAREKAILETMVWQQVDGIIWAPTVGFRGESVKISPSTVLVDAAIPMVLVDRTLPITSTQPSNAESNNQNQVSNPNSTNEPSRFPGVYQEDYAMAYKKVWEVLRAQSTSTGTLVSVSLDLDASSLLERQKGAQAACQELGWKYVPILLHQQDPQSKDLESKLAHLVQSTIAQPLVFFSTTAGIAEKLYWLIHSSPLSESFTSRPASAPIIRFGESSTWMPSPFEEITQPHEAMGMLAGLWIQKLINPREDTQNRLVKTVKSTPSQSLSENSIDSENLLKSLLETCTTSYPEARGNIRISM